MPGAVNLKKENSWVKESGIFSRPLFGLFFEKNEMRRQKKGRSHSFPTQPPFAY
ncbi:hypothetical protein ES703_82259 [subsurface metagenome]